MTPKKLTPERLNELITTLVIDGHVQASMLIKQHIAAVEHERDVASDYGFRTAMRELSDKVEEANKRSDALRAERDALAEQHEVNLRRWEVADGEFIIDREHKLRARIQKLRDSLDAIAGSTNENRGTARFAQAQLAADDQDAKL